MDCRDSDLFHALEEGGGHTHHSPLPPSPLPHTSRSSPAPLQVFVMDYRDSDLFHVLEDTVRKQNAWKLGLVQPASRPPSPGPTSAAGSAPNSRRSSYAGGGGGGGVAGGGGEAPELARVHSTSRRVSYAGEEGGAALAPSVPPHA